MNYPVHFSSQLREHLVALRKARGLTQAALGQLLGVGQARIAEIEGNPGVVSADQLMKLLSALHASLVLHVADADNVGNHAPPSAEAHAPPSMPNTPTPARHLAVSPPDQGQWRVEEPMAERRVDAPKTARTRLGDAPSRPSLSIRSKKGSW